MPVDDRMRAQAQLILDGHPDRRDAPRRRPVGRRRRHRVPLPRSTRSSSAQPDAARVVDALGAIFDEVGYGDVPEGERGRSRREPVTSGLVRLTVPECPDGGAGPGGSPRRRGRARGGEAGAQDLRVPVHLPGDRTGRGARGPRPPSRRPAWTPAAAAASPGPGTTGEGVSVVIVDTGPDPAGRRRSSVARRGARARRRTRTPPTGRSFRTPATGRSWPGSCAASPRRQRSSSSGPSTSRAPTTRRGSRPAWQDALDRDPDIMVFTFTSATHRDQSLHTFDDFYERRSATGRDWSCSRPPATTTVTPDVAGRPSRA